ncbi:MAG: hypothetical protein R3C14_50870 [Caldilineaceae bacterium]
MQDDTFVWLQLGGQEVLLRPATTLRQPTAAYAATAVGLLLYTDTLAATVTQLRERGLQLVAQPDGSYLFTDPDGHWFQLVDPQEH